MIRIEAKKGLDVVKTLEKAGAELRLKRFANCCQYEKDLLICEAFSCQVVRTCEASAWLNDFSFERDKAAIEVSKFFYVILKAFDMRGHRVSKRIRIKVKLLKITPLLISDEKVDYSMEIIPNEYDEIISQAKERYWKAMENYSEYNLDMTEEEHNYYKLLTNNLDYWETILPSTVTYSKDAFASDFFDTLRRHRLTDKVGGEILLMKEIYYAAAKVFPLFKELSEEEKIQILDMAYTIGKRVERGKRDIHSFSKATFIAMTYMNKAKTFVVGRQMYTMTSADSKLLDCEYILGQTKCRRCFMPFDVWHALAKSTASGRMVA